MNSRKVDYKYKGETLENDTLKKISLQSGNGGPIEGAYIESKDINSMISYAAKKHIESVPKNKLALSQRIKKVYDKIDMKYSEDREPYDVYDNNCGTFALDVIKADNDISTPTLVVNTTPNNIVDELHEEEYKKLTYDGETTIFE